MDLLPLSPDETEFSWSDETTPNSDLFVEAYQRINARPSTGRVQRSPVLRIPHDQPRTENDFPCSLHSLHSKISHMADLEAAYDHSSSNFIFVASAQVPTPRWARTGFVEDIDEETEEGAREVSPQDEDIEDLLEPKLESPDSDGLTDLLDISLTRAEALCVSPTAKRGRGRPRKHPIRSPEAKVAKGRSKTGCITCRKRKKKCDEAKPECLNCVKNAVTCEGYAERTLWKSGKDKAEEARMRRVSLPAIYLPPVIHGVETLGDRIFFEHFVTRLSVVLTVEGPNQNAFKDMLLPMATQHLGLMHSILALSSSHIDYSEPYGSAIMRKHPSLTSSMLQQRSQFHEDEALAVMRAVIDKQNSGVVDNAVLSSLYGQMLCLIVQGLAEGKTTGEHRYHLRAYQQLIRQHPPEDTAFMEFVKEYFQFHISLDELIGGTSLEVNSEDWDLPPSIIQPDAVRLLGVHDRLFACMSKITNIRSRIRHNMQHGLDPVVDCASYYNAAEVDAEIRDWSASWPQTESARDIAGTLYKQMMWVYLYRTIYPPTRDTWAPDSRITAAVDTGLELIAMIGPHDPSQTLLLAPTFVIGCAAFKPEQREPIRTSIETIKRYTKLKNGDLVLSVLMQVWKYMDLKDERSWDWQNIARSMGMDFLAT